MKKIFSLIAIIVSLNVAAQTLYVPSNADSLKIPISVSGAIRSVYVTDLIKSKLSLQGGTLTGTTNTGFIGFPPQTTALTVPADGFKLYDSAGLTLLRNDGYRRVLSFAGLTANVKYNFPVGTTNDTVTTNIAPQALRFKTLDGLYNYFSNIPAGNLIGSIADARLSSNVSLLNSAQTFTASRSYATGTDLSLYNTADQVTNFERARMFWSGNQFIFTTERGGTGIFRDLVLGNGGGNILFSSGIINLGNGFISSAANRSFVNLQAASSASSGISNFLFVGPTINQTSTAGYRGVWISPYEQGTGSGSKLLIDAGTNSAANGGGTHTTKFSVDNIGVVTSVGYTTTGLISQNATLGSALTGHSSILNMTQLGNAQAVQGHKLNITYNQALATGVTNTDLLINRNETNLGTTPGLQKLFDLQVGNVSKFSVDNAGSVKSAQYNLSVLNTAPATATSTGTTGEIRWTSTAVFLCVATNTWVKATLATF